MRCALFIYLLFAYSISYAQTSRKDREPSNNHLVKPLADSTWNRLSIREKVNYCLKTGERDIQLCGRWGGGYVRDTRHFIFDNTGQYYFLGEYTYSNRQYALFETYSDSLAWYLREDLFEKGEDLFYWHNIIRRMTPKRNIANVLREYYDFIKEQDSAPLTLLMQWMERDSFAKYLQSPFYQKLSERPDYRVPHTLKYKEQIRDLIRDFIQTLPYQQNNWDKASSALYDSLKQADHEFASKHRLSDWVFNRLNARELLAYCENKCEKYGQICGITTDVVNKIHLLPDKFVSGPSGDFSERQIKRLKENRDSVAWYVLNSNRERMIAGATPNYNLILLLHIWQVIPDLLKMDRVNRFNRYLYMPVLCQFMLINSYPPFLSFWKKNAVDNNYVIRTKKNEEMILQLAGDYYQWKMEATASVDK